MKIKFPFDHFVNTETKEVWIVCSGSTTALGIPALVKKHYPGYAGHIASKSYLEELKNGNN